MAKNFSQNYFFVDPGKDLLVSIEGHEFKRKNKWEERNGKIRIEVPEFELEISLPKEDLKKLMVKAEDFFKKAA